MQLLYNYIATLLVVNIISSSKLTESAALSSGTLSITGESVGIPQHQESLLIRNIRQVVPTAYKPTCKPGKRLNIHNECVPNIKLAISSTKTTSKRPHAQNLMSTTTDINNKESVSTSEGSLNNIIQPSSTVPQEPLSSNSEKSTTLSQLVVTNEITESQYSIDHIHDVTTEHLTSKSPRVQDQTKSVTEQVSTSTAGASVRDRKAVKSSRSDHAVSSNLQVYHVYSYNTRFTRRHKCYYSKDKSSEKIQSSANEDYDY